MNEAFAKSLIRAQQNMPKIAKTGKAQYGAYMTVDDLNDHVVPILNANGIGLAQFPTQNDQGFPSLTIVLIHESGDMLEFEMPLVMDSGPRMNSTQAQGSAITYARRYQLGAALGISTEKDDDGSAATQKKPKTAPKKAKEDNTPSENGPVPTDPGEVELPGGPYAGRTIHDAWMQDPAHISAVAKGAKNEVVRVAAEMFLEQKRIEGEAHSDSLPF